MLREDHNPSKGLRRMAATRRIWQVAERNATGILRGRRRLNAKDLIKKAEDMFHIKEELNQKYYMNGREFLPLAVWATRGFDANQITERSAESDKRKHPVLGMTFRVKIRTPQVLSTRACTKKQVAAGDGADGADLTTDADLQTQPERQQEEGRKLSRDKLFRRQQQQQQFFQLFKRQDK